MELMNKLKYFEFSKKPSKSYVIEDFYSHEQGELDQKALNHILCGSFKNERRYVFNFLNHHQFYSREYENFINHIESIMISFHRLFEYESGINFKVEQYMNEWLMYARAKMEPKKENTDDPLFEDIFKDKAKIEVLLVQLRLKGYVRENSTSWKRNKNEVVALFTALEAKEMINKCSQAAYSRIFGKFFNIAISSQLSRKIVNNDIQEPLDRIVESINT